MRAVRILRHSTHRLRSVRECMPVFRNIPDAFRHAPQQKKESSVTDALWALLRSKTLAEAAARSMGGALMAAAEKPRRLMAEDLCREAGYMLPQSANARAFLERVKRETDAPASVVDRLSDTIPVN